MCTFMDLGKEDLAKWYGLVDLDKYVHVIGYGEASNSHSQANTPNYPN